MVEPFTVALPTSHTGFAPDLLIRSCSADWGEVLEGEDGPRLGRDIRVPDFIFEAERRVEDETAYRLFRDGSLSAASGSPEVGCIAVVLESPHREEFQGRGGRALGPLRDQRVRAQVEKHLPRLIVALSRKLGEPLGGRSIALVNAVQYQTSLQAIMQNYEGRLRSGVRTPVWKTIFRNGGSANLLERLKRYEPRAVLLATTDVVRRDVRRLFKTGNVGRCWMEVNYHPSYWERSEPHLRGRLHLA